MISFDLKCAHNHVFEAWFRSSSDYEDQKNRGFLSCPVCGDTAITKAIMAPAVGRKTNQGAVAKPSVPAGAAKQDGQAVAAGPAKPVVQKKDPVPVPEAVKAELVKYMTALKQHVVETCDDVGTDFPEEARKIHYGETEERGIYGTADKEDVQELLDEGIDLVPLPITPARSVQ